ncbi:hypothetical protein LN042_18815 [Kitasatospora sp. RB6PN24]|uniref:hypothetical protein n=1 Tax=Kitasatospora humi TaxID=2893891 RepID=UPI001E624B8E|nr:hypothetical protein [Kitasatospora humi]MCC9309108.1 hypothetical protein [Kitasatospora humi]
MASRDVQIGRAAAEVAERMVREAQTSNALLQRIGLGHLPQEAIEGGASIAVGDAGLTVQEIRASTTMAATWRLWGRGKTVLAVHPEMGAELRTYKVGKMDGGVFRRLRHPDPLIVLAEPWPCALSDGSPGRLLGLFAIGRVRNSTLLCSTSDKRMGTIAVMAVAEVLEDPDGLPMLEFIHCSIPAEPGDRFTAYDLAARIARKAGREDPTPGQQGLLEDVLRLVSYVCSSKADIELAAPSSGKSAKRGPRAWNKPESFLRVGWRLGPRLRLARIRAQEAGRRARASAGSGTGASGWRQYPHQRGGHLKTVWKGPGRAIEDVALVEPYWVSQDLLDGDGHAPEGVVRPVR